MSKCTVCKIELTGKQRKFCSNACIQKDQRQRQRAHPDCITIEQVVDRFNSVAEDKEALRHILEAPIIEILNYFFNTSDKKIVPSRNKSEYVEVQHR